MPAYTSTTIDSRTTGHKTINGTRWPIETVLKRIQWQGRRARWLVLQGLCDGYVSASSQYRTLREAREAFEAGR